jgi:ubiquinone/menaquinone biosynthesis C-methylase UbiE
LIGTEGHPFPAWLSFHLNNELRRRSHPPEKIIDVLGVKATDAVLDFGCGPGFYTIPFAKIAREVVAVDIQSKMLGKVSKYAEKNGVKVKALQSNGQSIPLPEGHFDLIFLSGVYHELSEKRKVLTELKRLLKPSGRIVLRERTKTGHFSPGRPAINPLEVSEELRAVGFIALAPATDPSDRTATLMTATA